MGIFKFCKPLAAIPMRQAEAETHFWIYTLFYHLKTNMSK